MMNSTTNPKLQQFLTRLADGRYASIGRARSALGGTVGLTEDDKAEARRAMDAHFNPKAQKAQPAPAPANDSAPRGDEAQVLRRGFATYRAALAASIEALISAAALGHVPESFKPQLYKILHPVVVRHGDPLALVTFGAAFRGLADKEEIKQLVKKLLKPDVDARLDAILDGIDPVDTFESVPSMLPPSVAAGVRNDLMRNLGMPVREMRQTHGIPPFLNDLLSTIGRHTRG